MRGRVIVVGLCVSQSVQSVCIDRLADVDIKRGDMDKYHESSEQEDSGDVLSKRKHFPAAS